jgi:hypothetical protein
MQGVGKRGKFRHSLRWLYGEHQVYDSCGRHHLVPAMTRTTEVRLIANLISRRENLTFISLEVLHPQTLLFDLTKTTVD